MCDSSYLREVLDYCPQSGVCTWKQRPRTDFSTSRSWKAWLRKHQGTEAGKYNPSTCKLTVSINQKTFNLDKLIWARQYGEVPTNIYHKNQWGCDNALDNLTTDPPQGYKTTSYNQGMDFTLSVAERKEVPFFRLSSDQHLISHHLDPITARTRMVEMADWFGTGFEDLT